MVARSGDPLGAPVRPSAPLSSERSAQMARRVTAIALSILAIGVSFTYLSPGAALIASGITVSLSLIWGFRSSPFRHVPPIAAANPPSILRMITSLCATLRSCLPQTARNPLFDRRPVTPPIREVREHVGTRSPGPGYVDRGQVPPPTTGNHEPVGTQSSSPGSVDHGQAVPPTAGDWRSRLHEQRQATAQADADERWRVYQERLSRESEHLRRQQEIANRHGRSVPVTQAPPPTTGNRESVGAQSSGSQRPGSIPGQVPPQTTGNRESVGDRR
jgi:hypothetical protein